MRKILVFFGLIALLSAPALAFETGPGQMPPGPGGADDPCRGDVETLCSDVTPGQGRILMCLQSKIDKLSPACRQRLEEGKKKFDDARKACGPDVQKFCGGVQPGEGRIIRCLKDNYNDLSPECRATFDQAKERIKTRRGNR